MIWDELFLEMRSEINKKCDVAKEHIKSTMLPPFNDENKRNELISPTLSIPALFISASFISNSIIRCVKKIAQSHDFETRLINEHSPEEAILSQPGLFIYKEID